MPARMRCSPPTRRRSSACSTTADTRRSTSYASPKARRTPRRCAQKFLSEHLHTEDEVRFFVEGSGAFYLHLNGKVYQAVLVRGDLISVPAGTLHWFDMGPDPEFTAMRWFNNPEGWVAQYSGSEIATRFPKYE